MLYCRQNPYYCSILLYVMTQKISYVHRKSQNWYRGDRCFLVLLKSCVRTLVPYRTQNFLCFIMYGNVPVRECTVMYGIVRLCTVLCGTYSTYGFTLKSFKNLFFIFKAWKMQKVRFENTDQYRNRKLSELRTGTGTVLSRNWTS